MTEEEKNAIEYIKKEIDYFKTTILGFEKEMEDKDWLRKNVLELKNDISARETILNLIQKQEKEIQQVLDDYQELGKDYHKLECESEKKDTEINKLNNLTDKLVKRIKYDTEWFYSDLDNKSEEEIKEYFMKQE